MKQLHRGAAIVAALIAASRASAQQTPPSPHGRPRVPVVLAMVDSAMAAPSYRILRQNGGGVDVIVLGINADSAIFTNAVSELLLIRRSTGDTAAVEGEVRVRPNATTPSSAAPLPWANRVLGDLRAAGLREVPHVGRERVVRIWLPAQRHARGAQP